MSVGHVEIAFGLSSQAARALDTLAQKASVQLSTYLMDAYKAESEIAADTAIFTELPETKGQVDATAFTTTAGTTSPFEFPTCRAI